MYQFVVSIKDYTRARPILAWHYIDGRSLSDWPVWALRRTNWTDKHSYPPALAAKLEHEAFLKALEARMREKPFVLPSSLPELFNPFQWH